MASKLERQFTTDFKHSMIAAGAEIHKIADAPHFAGQKTRFDIQKPFDGFAGWRGIPIAFEVKALDSFQAFGPGLIRPNQLEGLSKWERCGFATFVILNVRLSTRENWMFWFPWWKLQALWHGSGSIKKAHLESLVQTSYCTPVIHSKLEQPGKSAKYIDRYDVTRFLHDAERVYWDLAKLRSSVENPPF